MKIRKKTGEIVEVFGDYILQPGESLVGGGFTFLDGLDPVQRSVMDGTRDSNDRRNSEMTDARYWADREAYLADYGNWLHDADGNPVVRWGDYIGSPQHDEGLRAVEEAHAEQKTRVADEWQRPDPAPTAVDRTPPQAPPTILQPTDDDLAAGKARVAAAREEHRNWLENAWRDQ
jgi:hypothetical protein